MYVLLPREGVKYPEFVRGLTSESWQKWQGLFGLHPGIFKLPRFNIEFEADLTRPLRTLGVRLAQSDGADFSGMSAPGSSDAALALGMVAQKTSLVIDEKGTEASAANLNKVINVGIHKQQPELFTMVVDHPFFCAIVDELTGVVLFAGVMTEVR